MSKPERTVVVVGGGITGLSAAWTLTRSEWPTRVVVVESEPRFGGKLVSSPFAGLPSVDEGADAFLARVPEAVALCRQLGLDDELVSPATGRAYLWWNGAMHTLPDGLVLGVPAGLARLARGNLLSWPGKLRAALEPFLPRGHDPSAGDNLGALIRHRFGDEVLERLVDPLLGGINAGDADRLSLAASAPQIADVAGRSRSLLIGLRRQRAAAAAAAASAPVPVTAAAPAAVPIFFAPRGGMAQLVERLTNKLVEGGVELRASTPIDRVERRGSSWRVGGIDCDAVIVTAPAPVARLQLADVAPRAASMIGAIEHASVAMVTLAFDEGSVGRSLDGSGHLVPKPQQRYLTACSWASTKWAHWKLPGVVVLRASLGRFGNEAAAHGSDDELRQRAIDNLRPALRLSAEPVATRITRWERAFPQYLPGHLDRVAQIEAALAEEAPGVAVAGAAYRGIGIPACIRQGATAATAATTRSLPL